MADWNKWDGKASWSGNSFPSKKAKDEGQSPGQRSSRGCSCSCSYTSRCSSNTCKPLPKGVCNSLPKGVWPISGREGKGGPMGRRTQKAAPAAAAAVCRWRLCQRMQKLKNRIEPLMKQLHQKQLKWMSRSQPLTKGMKKPMAEGRNKPLPKGPTRLGSQLGMASRRANPLAGIWESKSLDKRDSRRRHPAPMDPQRGAQIWEWPLVSRKSIIPSLGQMWGQCGHGQWDHGLAYLHQAAASCMVPSKIWQPLEDHWVAPPIWGQKKSLPKGFALPQPLAKRELPMVNQNLLPKEGAMPGQNVLPKEVQFHANTSCQKRCQMCRWTLRHFFSWVNLGNAKLWE